MENKILEWRELKLKLQPMLDELGRLEKEIKAEVLETGYIPEVEGVKVQLRKGYIRSSWDDKGLRGFAVVHPEILALVKESRVGDSVSLLVKK